MQKGHRWGQKRERDSRARRDILDSSCRCPRCGYKISDQAAVPCSSIPCPQCRAPMVESNWK